MGEVRSAGCADLMERMGFQGKVLEENGDSFLFRQTWEGWPLFSQQVTLVCEGDRLAAVTAGRQLAGKSREDTGRRTITVATALVDFFNGVGALGDVCNRIDAIEPGYAASTSLSGPILLTPVWRVTTDTGAYQLDNVTGGVTRVF